MIPIPFEPTLFGIDLNVHLVLEYLAFFIGFQFYKYQRKHTKDAINNNNRLSIILGAIIGALIGSRLVGFLENPVLPELTLEGILNLYNTKTIMGGLFGGLLGVEISKKIIGETNSSGDLFALPLIIGILIGRVGCFLSGTNEFTYGKATTFFTGMDLGDGVLRHPTSLYEVIFLIILFIIIRQLQHKSPRLQSGLTFQYFMLAYFGFRFFIEFLKPNIFFTLGLSSIQWLCIICWLYYSKTLFKLFNNAR